MSPSPLSWVIFIWPFGTGQVWVVVGVIICSGFQKLGILEENVTYNKNFYVYQLFQNKNGWFYSTRTTAGPGALVVRGTYICYGILVNPNSPVVSVFDCVKYRNMGIYVTRFHLPMLCLFMTLPLKPTRACAHMHPNLHLLHFSHKYSHTTSASWRLKLSANRVFVKHFRITSMKRSKPALLALCEGNPPVTLHIMTSSW